MYGLNLTTLQSIGMYFRKEGSLIKVSERTASLRINLEHCNYHATYILTQTTAWLWYLNHIVKLIPFR